METVYTVSYTHLDVYKRQGIRNNKVGFAEIFSRFSDEFVTLVPQGRDDRLNFYQKLISDVALPNIKAKENLPKLISSCISTIGKNTKDETLSLIHI